MASARQAPPAVNNAIAHPDPEHDKADNPNNKADQEYGKRKPEDPNNDDPQQRVAKLRARGHIGGPVARVDKADGHEQSGADMPCDVESSVTAGASGAKMMFEMVDHGALLRAVCLTPERIPVLGSKVNQD